MAAKEEDGKDGMLGGLREMAQMLQEMISQDTSSQGVDSDHDVGQGGENKLNSDGSERSNEKGSSNHQLAGLSTTYNVLVSYKKSDLTNDETQREPLGSGKKVTLLRRPPSTRMISPSGPPMADVVKRSLRLSLKPIKNDPSLHDKSFAKSYLQLGDSDLASKYNLPDDDEVTNPIDYTSSDYDAVRYQLQEHFSLLSIENDDDSKELSQIDSSSSDHLEAEPVQYETHVPVSDFTSDVREPVNPEKAPPKPSLQRQNAMRQQRYTRELDPGYSASYLNQPMPTRDSINTASSHGYRPSVSMTNALTTSTDLVPKRNQQAMNPHYSQCHVPSGQYGNITNSPYTTTNQNESYNMPQSAAAFQQHGGSNMAHNGTFPYWRPEQNDSYNMPQYSAVSVAPYAYGSVNLFGMSSDNAANSRFGYEGVSTNHLSSVQQHQSGDSIVWAPIPRRSHQQEQQLRSEIFGTMNQQNDTSHDPSDQTQQRLWPRHN